MLLRRPRPIANHPGLSFLLIIVRRYVAMLLLQTALRRLAEALRISQLADVFRRFSSGSVRLFSEEPLLPAFSYQLLAIKLAFMRIFRPFRQSRKKRVPAA